MGIRSVGGIDLVGNGVVVGTLSDGWAVGEVIIGDASPQPTTTSASKAKRKLRYERFLNMENFRF